MVRFLLSIIFYLTAISQLQAQDVEVKAFTDTSSYYIGDYINFTLSIEYPDNISVIKPFFRDSLKNFEIISELKPETNKTDKKNHLIYKFILSFYDSASVVIPPIKVFYKTKPDTTIKSVQSDSLIIQVNKLKVNIQEDIKDVKPPLRIPFDWLTLILWILAAILLLLLIIFLYRKFFSKNKTGEIQKADVILPPYEEALMKLDQLDREQLWQKGEIKEYHSKITEIIREYFEKRFGLPALELPTSEQLKLLKRIPEASIIYELTESFLTNADLVKFAKFIPMDGVNSEMMKQAVEIVKRTIPAGENINRSEDENVQ